MHARSSARLPELVLLFLSLSLGSGPSWSQPEGPPVEFRATETFAAGDDVRNVVDGDFNDDGEVDFFVLDGSSPSGFFLNDGMGGFARADVDAAPDGESGASRSRIAVELSPRKPQRRGREPRRCRVRQRFSWTRTSSRASPGHFSGNPGRPGLSPGTGGGDQHIGCEVRVNFV